MEKTPPAPPSCPTCKKAAQFSREINVQVEFWECEDKHMFVVNKKPPPRVAEPAAAASPVEGPKVA